MVELIEYEKKLEKIKAMPLKHRSGARLMLISELEAN